MQAWYGLILLIAVIAFCLTAYRLAWDNQLRAIDQNIYGTEGKLAAALMVSKPSIPGAVTRDDENPPISASLLIEHLRAVNGKVPKEIAPIFEGTDPGYAYFSFRNGKGKIFLESANFPEGASLLPMPVGRYSEEWRTTEHRRELLRSSKPGLSSLVGRDISPELDSMHRFAWSLGLSSFAGWLVCLLGGWWIAGNAIRPITEISRTAAHIAAGNLQERISPSGTDSELDQLGRVLNHTFDRLQAAIEQQKQFIADASHELRTPVTILLSETQRIMKHDRKRTVDEYRQVVQTCGDAADRMRRLIEPLLVLARQEALGAHPLRERCDLSTILRNTLAELEPLRAAKKIHLSAQMETSPCMGDPAALTILTTNLIANAIQHNRESGELLVSCVGEGDLVTFSISDNGPGIAPENLPHVFERFYRADKSRSSSNGHAGLGLAIAKAIVDNHGGTIKVATALGKGSVFTVTLPKSSNPAGIGIVTQLAR